MANKKAKSEEILVDESLVVEKVVEAEEAVTAEPVQESVYTAAEIADNYKVFGTYREIVVVALRKAGKKTATFSEAKDIIEKFKTKEVK